MTDAQNVTDNVPPTEIDWKESVVVVGKEDVGKSELVAGLFETMSTSRNVRGTTVDVKTVEDIPAYTEDIRQTVVLGIPVHKTSDFEIVENLLLQKELL